MDISYVGLLLSTVLLIYPVLIFIDLKIPLIKTMFYSFLRMVIQLAVIGLLLQFIFQSENLWLTLGWMFVMITAAVITLKSRLKLNGSKIIPILFTSLGVTTLVIMPWIIIFVIRPDPIYSPVYLIPVYGMVLGNSMNSCALVLDRFESGLSDNWKAYYARICIGASLNEAVLPVFRKALQTSITPQILTVASIGIVSLPGMMTGQILGGASPLIAIKYQMMIMISILTGVTLTDYIAVKLYIRNRFDKYYIPKENTH